MAIEVVRNFGFDRTISSGVSALEPFIVPLPPCAAKAERDGASRAMVEVERPPANAVSNVVVGK
jgi:hypothetical protein